MHSNIVPTGTQQSQLPLHPPQQPTPQPPIQGQHVGQGSVIPMAYFVQQQAFSAPPHQQAIGKVVSKQNFNFRCLLWLQRITKVLF